MTQQARHGTASVPLIDMAPFMRGDAAARRDTARQFGRAFEETGFAAIVNHGVSARLADDVYAQAKAFFALPLDHKSQLMPPEKVKGRGYLPMGIESVAATLDGETPPDLCEALVFASLQRERDGRGQRNLWPSEPPGFEQNINAWFDAIHGLCGRLMRMSALALDLPEDWFDACFSEPALTLRFVNYPDQPVEPRPGQLRYGAHHDYGGLTILRQDNAPGGLEVCDLQGRWHDVPVIADSFVINVGDLMQRWTNGRWRSTLHRVSNPPRDLTGSTQRLSMVAFTGPEESTSVECLPSCCDAAHPARFEPVIAGEYIQGKLRSSMELTAPASSR
ncbi:isopenicillin N synthase-like dioxygenase [Variovorax paradoxus]|uniref:2-oxoglutarate-dependent ethylene/succinate-forming enzyme n=1 Tax=Variovorax paradoxus TaxID=34073 RepID=A0AAE4BYC7_VARPD|nr:2-oxoglutarate and iron-dependent oxygenase domain-containing protein [Variovorax paradoxus]MDR6426752.1 isopenicillin N synthase-like dioxygenase [Variovorax paradoxus]